jgi:hypothetical protein
LIKRDTDYLFFGELGKAVDRDRFDVEWLTETASVPLLDDMITAVFCQNRTPTKTFANKMEWNEFMATTYGWEVIA